MCRKYLLAVALLTVVTVLQVAAQSVLDDDRFNRVHEARVKTLNEFIHRFNADEIPAFVQQTDSDKIREMCLAALFDMDWIEQEDNRQLALGFIERTVSDSVMLDVHDSTIYAEAHCVFIKGKEEVPISIVLRFEQMASGRYIWTIVGVNGLVEAGLIDTSFYGTLSPIQHELGFMRLNAAFPEMYGFTSRSTHIDQLSYLMALSSVGKVKFGECNSITYHCFAVPEYLFKIEQKNRNTANSGWLVSAVYLVEGLLKEQYLNTLLVK